MVEPPYDSGKSAPPCCGSQSLPSPKPVAEFHLPCNYPAFSPLMSIAQSSHDNPANLEGNRPVRWHRHPLTWLCLMLLPLRILYALRYRVDSDEPQHMHVVWGWVHGMLPYKDFFENHTPLFHMICAPLLKLFGERPESFLLMRVMMIPCYLLTLWCVYRIASHLFSQRDALWATIFTALFPPFYFCSVEFRSDDLWMALWLLGVGVWICQTPTARSRFLSGILMGAALGASMKTIALLLTFGAGAALAVLGKNSCIQKGSFARMGAFLLGFILVPFLIILFFCLLGAGHDLYFGTLGFNSMGGLGRWHRTSALVQWGLFFAILVPSYLVARFIRSQNYQGEKSEEPALARQRAGLFLGAMTYFAVLRCFWPLLDREHDLPLYPALFAIAVPAVLIQIRKAALKQHWDWLPQTFALACLITEFIRVLTTGVLGNDYTRPEMRLISEVIRLTNPGESVLDLKGETIFQNRSIWPVYEGITLARLKANLIKDDIPEHLVATRTCVATLDNWRFQKHAREFLNANYIPVGEVRVAGQFLQPKGDQGYVFHIEVPTRYSFVDEHGPIPGTLDGKPCAGSHSLKAGDHHFLPNSSNPKRIAVVWTRAIDRGFSPFSLSGTAD